MTVAALLLLSCASPDASETRSSPPDGVSIAVYQSRADVVARALEISVTNDSIVDAVVTDARFISDQFTEPAIWQKDATIVRAGRTVDLRVALPDAACEVTAPEPVVRLTVASGDEDPVVAEVTPTDERARLPELRAEECFVQTVEAVADLRAETLPRTVSVAGTLATQLDVTVVPAASADAGVITVDSAAGTTLFTVVDPVTGQPQTSYPIGSDVPAVDGAPITLTLVPNRCDPHAVAEDKRGTLFPLTVTAPDDASESGSVTGEVYVAAAPAVKEALIAFIGDVCAVG